MSGKYAKQLQAAAFGSLVLAVAVALCVWGFQQHRRLSDIETRGVATVGLLQDADVQLRKGIPVAYTFTVRYLDRLQRVDVDRALFARYVTNERFMQNAPIDLTYLPDRPDDVMPTQMRGKRFYWASGPLLKFLYALPVFAIGGVIFWAISLSLRMPARKPGAVASEA